MATVTFTFDSATDATLIKAVQALILGNVDTTPAKKPRKTRSDKGKKRGKRHSKEDTRREWPGKVSRDIADLVAKSAETAAANGNFRSAENFAEWFISKTWYDFAGTARQRAYIENAALRGAVEGGWTA